MTSSSFVSTPPQGTDAGVLPPLDQLRGFRIHLIGIGGCGMSALATLLLRHGAHVSGTDRTPSTATQRLQELGAAVTFDQTAASVPADTRLVVASAAIPADHPELQTARDRGLPAAKYAELLGEVMRFYDGIAISGTHGKSTTTAWLAHVLRSAGLEPNFVVGAASEQLGGSSGVGAGSHFVAEACEFDRSFLHLRPRYATILNIDEDHLDCYADLAAIRAAFADFGRGLPPDGYLLVNGDDPYCRALADEMTVPTERFGLDVACEWRAVDLASTGGFYRFNLLHHGRQLAHLNLGIAGRHNVYNALAVVALAQRIGVALPTLRSALGSYRGVGRRLELRAVCDDIHIVDDYAHHPVEIRATLAAARERFQPRRLWCVFQPHQHSRTRFLLEDFAASFTGADHILVPDIYFVRDSAREREAVSAGDLVDLIRAGGGAARYIPEFDSIVEHLLSELRSGDVVLTMGAGSIWKVADELVRRLRSRLPA